MHDFDPRDFTSHERDDRRPDLSRGGHGEHAARGPDRATRDPRDIAVRHVDLPSGPRREPVRVRGRDYSLNGGQSRVLATVGAFRVVSSHDLEASFGRAGDHRSADLRHLRENGLIDTVPRPGHGDRIVTLTERGRDLLEAQRRPGEGGAGARQAFYAGVRKPRELEHDAQVYRAYREAAQRLTGRGSRLRRVVLDYELKREYQRFLQQRNRGRADGDGRPDREAEEIAAWAIEHHLPYFDEQVHFPDVRIEYEDVDGRSREEDVEVTTPHYRGAHAAAVTRSGFSGYGGVSARVSFGRGSGRGRGGGRDPRLAEEMLS
jgi:DNA-binding PadR family transcriptional regulator